MFLTGVLCTVYGAQVYLKLINIIIPEGCTLYRRIVHIVNYTAFYHFASTLVVLNLFFFSSFVVSI